MFAYRFPLTTEGFSDLYDKVSAGQESRSLFGLVKMGKNGEQQPAATLIRPFGEFGDPSIATVVLTVGRFALPVSFFRVRIDCGQPVLEQSSLVMKTVRSDVSVESQQALFEHMGNLEWQPMRGKDATRYDSFQRMAHIALQLAEQQV